MRSFQPSATEEVRQLLDRLTDPAEPPAVYRTAMSALGERFVNEYRADLAGIGRLLLVCTNEDADFLARGVLTGLSELGGLSVHVACLWNERETVVGSTTGERVEMAPVVRRYVEPGDVDAFLVVKSIISSACVVKANITEMVAEFDPERVLIFAPVVLKGAGDRLRNEFDEATASRFEFYWFAEDDEKDGDDVKPGIGGQVYERLGLGTRHDKNRYTPELIKERRTVPV
jgi:hypothetical protein